MTDLVQEIATRSASLPADLQHEVLDFVEFVSEKRVPQRKSFESDRGILHADLSHLEEDLVEIRKEMWNGFGEGDIRI